MMIGPMIEMKCRECGCDCDDKNQGEEHYSVWKIEGFCATCHPKFIEDKDTNEEFDLYRGIYEF